MASAFQYWLFRWHEEEAVERGQLTREIEVQRDGYGRQVGTKVRRHGSWWKHWRKGWNKPVYVLGVEPHKSGDLHMHALVKFDSELRDLNRKRGWHLWFGPKAEGCLGYGMARIEPPRSDGDVKGYISKYVCCEDGELFMADSFRAVTVEAPCV